MSPAALVVVDTGVLLAAADADDRWHAQASEVLEQRPAAERSRTGCLSEAFTSASLARIRFDIVPTEGLVFARTRHATSRAGDPEPHDHVLIANVCRVADGGSRGAHRGALR